MSVCAFSSICEEDACWLPQYLSEAERLNLPFVMHLDRCSSATRLAAANHPLCVGVTRQDDPRREFDETHKQGALDAVVGLRRFDWALAWDADETWERDAYVKLNAALSLNADYVDVPWVNLWGDPGHVRTDGPFGGGHRVKLYNLRTFRWAFLNPAVNGAYALDRHGKRLSPDTARMARHGLVCLHHGLMTPELREMHRRRWDRIYGKAVGRNPYKLWNYALDEANYPPVVIENPYL